MASVSPSGLPALATGGCGFPERVGGAAPPVFDAWEGGSSARGVRLGPQTARSFDATVIVPTFCERERIEKTLQELDAQLCSVGVAAEILVVDDDSPDGTARLASLAYTVCPKRVHVRRAERGLSTAVLHGAALARGRVCLVMDADGSHSVDLVPSLLQAVLSGRAEMAIATRYGDGGGTSDWPLRRRVVSWVARLLARPLTAVTDPMSGFFSFDTTIVRRGALSPVGYKVGLELLVRCRPSPVLEVPYVFRDRDAGSSKMSSRQIAEYLRHLQRLYLSRISELTRSRVESSTSRTACSQDAVGRREASDEHVRFANDSKSSTMTSAEVS